jgi:cysteinyl-tRNA synthetase
MELILFHVQTLRALNGTRFSRASEYVDCMERMIRVLVDKGLAYESDGSVYFSVNASSTYGSLAPGRALAVESLADNTNEGKRDKRDFALWKQGKGVRVVNGKMIEVDEATAVSLGVAWKSGFGCGRPGKCVPQLGRGKILVTYYFKNRLAY